jgi:hypothetical protein
MKIYKIEGTWASIEVYHASGKVSIKGSTGTVVHLDPKDIELVCQFLKRAADEVPYHIYTEGENANTNS